MGTRLPDEYVDLLNQIAGDHEKFGFLAREEEDDLEPQVPDFKPFTSATYDAHE